MLHNSWYLQMHWSRRCTIIFPASVSPHWTDQGRTDGGNAECWDARRWRRRWRLGGDRTSLLFWILLHHSMQWSSVEEIPCELQCEADDAIMKCARQQCDVWGRTHFKKWVQMYIFKSKATAVCYSRRPKIPFCAATLFTLSPLHAPLCPSWAWQGWRRWWSDDNDWTI